MTQFGNHKRDKIEDVMIYSYFRREIVDEAYFRKKSSSQPPNQRWGSCWKFDLHTGLEMFRKGNTSNRGILIFGTRIDAKLLQGCAPV